MAKVVFDFGIEMDMLNKGELDHSLAAQEERWKRAALAGRKYRRLPILSGFPVAGVLDIGGDTNTPQAAGSFAGQPAWSGAKIGPTEGNAWEVKRLAVNGLTSGGTPDVVNLIRPGSGPDAVWQFNGNNFAYTFGKLELVLLPSESMRLVSVGTFAATGQIRLSGEMVQIPAERLGELA